MIKVDVISGFLGAGKTTLIKHLLGHVYKNENVVLIENEFGEIGIDGGFLKEAGIEIREMNSGCICCSLVGDFATSLKEVVDTYHPERIIIEPSGVGKLSDVEKAVLDVAGSLDLEISHKIVVADVTKCKMYLKNFGEFYKNQIENANTIILSRTDIAKEEKVEEALNILKELNGAAAIVTTPVDRLEDEVLLKALENKSSAKSMLDEVEHEHHHHDGECCHHEHDEEHHHHDGECCHHEHDEEHHHHDGECCHHEHDGEHHHHDGECCHHEHDEEHHHHDGECCHHDHDHHHHHHADDVFTSWGTETTKAYTKSQINDILAGFDNETKGTILRSKGIVKDAESEEFIYFDYVPGQIDIRSGSPDYIGKVCVIAAGYTEEELKNIFLK
ncbi:MAG: GTP-binding protein [Lachnospiraceae bacterium]|nr:GTP-binding protein [Lachnospiraceae bacterium]